MRAETLDRLVPPARRFARGCGVALLCCVAALIVAPVAMVAVKVLNEILDGYPKLFALGVFAPVLAVFLRVAFREREEN